MTTGIYKATAVRVVGTADAWTAQNPVLENGVIGVENDTHKAKMGDGQTAWADLPYFGDVAASQTPAVTSVAGKTGDVTLAATDVSGLAQVATSGAYADLTGKPSIPAPYTLPAASHGTIGGVKTAAFMPGLAADPTKDDFNSLLGKLIAAGIMDAS